MSTTKLMELSNEMSILGFAIRKGNLTDEEKEAKNKELHSLSKLYNAELKRYIRSKSKVGVTTKPKN